MVIEYYHTKEQIADIFTKPLEIIILQVKKDVWNDKIESLI